MSVTSVVMIGANGRMGRMIASLAQEDVEFALSGVIDRESAREELKTRFGDCPVGASLEEMLPKVPAESVLVDFTAPAASMQNARAASAAGRPLVIGTTGFDAEQKKELAELAKKAPLFWSTNMSIGISVLCRILPELAKALGPDYDMEMVEIHHKHKKDAPSGTALTLGKCLAESRGWDADAVRCSGRDGIIGERPHEQIGIQALRGGDVVGVHTVYLLGPGERIEVSHQAHSRENFARGALRAAAWMADRKPGKLYGMLDVI